jgi:hypothetical protein
MAVTPTAVGTLEQDSWGAGVIAEGDGAEVSGVCGIHGRRIASTQNSRDECGDQPGSVRMSTQIKPPFGDESLQKANIA